MYAMAATAVPTMKHEVIKNAAAEPQIALDIAGVEKSYGAVRALSGVSLSVRRGELLTLLGPSGSGKSTLLKAIAGFEAIDKGKLSLEGVDLASLPPARREIGMVFQNYALFPHMTVAENVAFPLKMRGVPKQEIAQRVDEILQKVHLGNFGNRYPKQLSGGQQQRVALARAVVFQPKLLLLDEPFGALDRKLREGMQEEVRALQRRLGLTTIFITHDQEEALMMSDRIAVMQSGELLQVGVPEEIYARPNCVFVADFLGESNLLKGRVQSRNGETLSIDIGASTINCTRCPSSPVGDQVTLLLRPERLRPVTGEARPDNILKCRVTDVVYLGSNVKWRLETENGLNLIARGTIDNRHARLSVGEVVPFGWWANDGHLLETP
jgi:putative spermidine/putrescine transport system ATP-binding protein